MLPINESTRKLRDIPSFNLSLRFVESSTSSSSSSCDDTRIETLNDPKATERTISHLRFTASILHLLVIQSDISLFYVNFFSNRGSSNSLRGRTIKKIRRKIFFFRNKKPRDPRGSMVHRPLRPGKLARKIYIYRRGW